MNRCPVPGQPLDPGDAAEVARFAAFLRDPDPDRAAAYRRHCPDVVPGPPPADPCGRVDCHEPATHEIRPQYARPYLRCATHARESLDVEQRFDNRQTAGATMHQLEGTTGETGPDL